MAGFSGGFRHQPGCFWLDPAGTLRPRFGVRIAPALPFREAMMLNASPSIGPLPSAFSEAVRVQAAGRQPILFEDLSSEAKSTALQYVFDDEAPVEWSEEDVVLLHWRLLQELGGLSDPDTPLDEKLDTLRWVFTDPR